VITPSIKELLYKAIIEDLPNGDITSEACIPFRHTSKAKAIAKESMIVCGLAFAEEVFKLLDSSLNFISHKSDGQQVKKGEILFTIDGSTRAILSGERVALNILQRLSGIATLTRKYVQAIQGSNAKILDTRKTTPLLRSLEKYAVRVGGGQNHRFSLSDAILIKDNHIKAVGSIAEAIKRAKAFVGPTVSIEVEVENIEQLKEALQYAVDIVMLDNMSIEEIRTAVKLCRQKSHVKIEVSGGVTLDNVKDIAQCGVDYISVGAITHSAKAVDISLEID